MPVSRHEGPPCEHSFPPIRSGAVGTAVGQIQSGRCIFSSSDLLSRFGHDELYTRKTKPSRGKPRSQSYACLLNPELARIALSCAFVSEMRSCEGLT